MRISRKSFDRLVEDAIAALPPDIAQWLDEVPVIVEDHPAPGDSPEEPLDTPLGMYIGPGRDELRQSGELPPRVMIYRRTLMDACTNREQLAREIWKTLIHELGHHAGMNEEQLDAYGYGPMDDDDDEIDFDLE